MLTCWLFMLNAQCEEKNLTLSTFGSFRGFIFIIVLCSSVSGLRRSEAEDRVRNDTNSLLRNFSFTPTGYLSPKSQKLGREFPSKMATWEDTELTSSTDTPNLHLFIEPFLLKNRGLTEQLLHS